MSDVDHDHTSMAYLTITLITDKFCENKAYPFKISSETEEIVFKILPCETKTFVLPKYERFSIQALGAQAPGVSTLYSQQDGLLLEEDIQINICKKYLKQDEKATISGQIYWEFDNECQVSIPDVVSVYVVNEKDEIIQKQKE
ncbi:MAG TPA: hypothetical protein VIG45_01960 [Erysipelothrix sp.]